MTLMTAVDYELYATSRADYSIATMAAAAEKSFKPRIKAAIYADERGSEKYKNSRAFLYFFFLISVSIRVHPRLIPVSAANSCLNCPRETTVIFPL